MQAFPIIPFRCLRSQEALFSFWYGALLLLLQVVALGFIRDKYSYLRDGWNILDFLVVTLSIVSLSFSSMDLSVVKTFRGLRMLRPLRVINRVPELKVTFAPCIRT